jgi:hypothetical protein
MKLFATTKPASNTFDLGRTRNFFSDNRPQSIIQRNLLNNVVESPRNSGQRKDFTGFSGGTSLHSKTNTTGMPLPLKEGLEKLSGFDLSSVKVHYNSSEPSRMNALAYAQGDHIHLAPGREKYLPHEGWHVVQQKQGRVKPSMEAYGVQINHDETLEKESDLMGARALQHQDDRSVKAGNTQHAVSSTVKPEKQNGIIQRSVGFEFETDWYVRKEKRKQTSLVKSVTGDANYLALTDMKKGEAFYSEPGFEIQADETPQGTDIEFVTDPVDESVPANITNLMTNVTNAANALNVAGTGLAPGATFDPAAALAPLGGNVLKNVRIAPGAVPMNARPQATVGVRLRKIIKMLKTIRRDHNSLVAVGAGPAASELMGLGDHDIVATVVNRIAGAGNIPILGTPPSQKLKSLMGLLITVLYKGHSPYPGGQHGGALPYSKVIAPIMARTDFAAIFNHLPNAERTHFANNPGEFRDYILNTANLANSGATELFRLGFMDDNDHIRIPSLTRSKWLKGIARGTDKLKHSTWTRRKIEPQLGSMGNTVDHNVSGGIGNDGIILELRRIQGNIGIAQWGPLARRIGKFIRKINNNLGPINY